MFPFIAALLPGLCASAAFAQSPAAIVPASGGTPPTTAARADRATRFNGVWTIVDAPRTLRTADGKAPPLKAGTKLSAGADNTRRCLPAGVPRLFTQRSGAFRLVIGSTRAAMTFEQNHLFRLVYLDVPHFEAAGPAYMGQSTGRWDGDTLVIDTNGFNDQTWLDDAGLPHGERLHLIERLSLANDGTLVDRMTIEDPDTFAAPWDTVFRFRRRADPLLAEDYCLRRAGLLDQGK